jgi:hypothetical protein
LIQTEEDIEIHITSEKLQILLKIRILKNVEIYKLDLSNAMPGHYREHRRNYSVLKAGGI